jgi:hypothetical protein
VVCKALAHEPAEFVVAVARLTECVDFYREIPDVSIQLLGILVRLYQEKQRIMAAPKN